jgi:Uma2 family endonuclease
MTTTQLDHRDLPDSDRVPARHSFDAWQSALLSETLIPVLRVVCPDDNYFIGQGCGIYWDKTELPLEGCRAPEWFVALDVSRLLNGKMRRSYVLWQEQTSPYLLFDFVCEDGNQDWSSPITYHGKLWVYAQKIRPSFFGMYYPQRPGLAMYRLADDRWERLLPNNYGRYSLPSLGVELGLWRGRYADYELHWLRWWDLQGNLLLTGDEKAARLADKLKALGVDPEQV